MAFEILVVVHVYHDIIGYPQSISFRSLHSSVTVSAIGRGFPTMYRNKSSLCIKEVRIREPACTFLSREQRCDFS